MCVHVQVNAALAARAMAGQKRGAEPAAEPDAEGAPVSCRPTA